MIQSKKENSLIARNNKLKIVPNWLSPTHPERTKTLGSLQVWWDRETTGVEQLTRMYFQMQRFSCGSRLMDGLQMVSPSAAPQPSGFHPQPDLFPWLRCLRPGSGEFEIENKSNSQCLFLLFVTMTFSHNNSTTAEFQEPEAANFCERRRFKVCVYRCSSKWDENCRFFSLWNRGAGDCCTAIRSH